MTLPQHLPRRHIATTAVIAVIAALLVALFANLKSARPAIVTGSVACQSGATVAGVWIQAYRAEGVQISPPPGVLRSQVNYKASIYATSYQVHVGCGSDGQNWQVVPKSEYVTGTSNDFLCFDGPRHEAYNTCKLL
jgi:hypothetical protein